MTPGRCAITEYVRCYFPTGVFVDVPPGGGPLLVDVPAALERFIDVGER